MLSAAELFEEAASVSRPTFDSWLATLSDADRASIVENAPNQNISHTAFAKVVKVLGGKFGKESVTAWRKSNGHSR